MGETILLRIHLEDSDPGQLRRKWGERAKQLKMVKDDGGDWLECEFPADLLSERKYLLRMWEPEITKGLLEAKWGPAASEFKFESLGEGYWICIVSEALLVELCQGFWPVNEAWFFYGCRVWLEHYDAAEIVGELEIKENFSEEQIILGGGEKYEGWVYKRKLEKAGDDLIEGDEETEEKLRLIEKKWQNRERYIRGIFEKHEYRESQKTIEAAAPMFAVGKLVEGKCGLCGTRGEVRFVLKTTYRRAKSSGRVWPTKTDLWVCKGCEPIARLLFENVVPIEEQVVEGEIGIGAGLAG